MTDEIVFFYRPMTNLLIN